MARIWYSVMGEGYGHSTRSAEIIKKLKEKHTVMITGFDKSYFYLKKIFPKTTHKIEGPNFVHKENEIDIKGTVIEFIKTLPANSQKNMIHILRIINKFKPDLIISDFEPASHYFAYFLGIPLISLDNMNVLSRCKVKVKTEDILDYYSAVSVINLFNPRSDYHLIFTLKDFPKKDKNVELFPPVLRNEILSTKPNKKDFILVYQTSKTNIRLIENLKKLNNKFVFYGMNASKTEKNILFKKFSKNGFIRDLADCKGVIMTGGFTTISEAIYFKKPMLIIPSENQYEQKFNGDTIEEMGIGLCRLETNKENLQGFISKISSYEKNFKKISDWDQKKILDRLEELIVILSKRKKPVFDLVRKASTWVKFSHPERTLTILKPDAVEKGLIGEIIKRFEKNGIKPVAIKMKKINKTKARRFYSHLKGKLPDSVFKSNIDYMTSDNVVLIVWQGKGVVKKVRALCGPTDPKKAKKKHIRSFSDEDMEKKLKKGKAVKNIIHSSATLSEAKNEISRFFMPWEIQDK